MSKQIVHPVQFVVNAVALLFLLPVLGAAIYAVAIGDLNPFGIAIIVLTLTTPFLGLLASMEPER